MKIKFLGLIIATALFMSFSGNAIAATSDPVLISKHADWSVFTFTQDGGKVCFMSSQPQKSEGKYKKRGEVHFFITHWEKEKTKNVVSVSTGYTYKAKSNVSLKIGKNNFSLFTQGETAWANDQETDNKIALWVTKGSTMIIEGSSKRDTATKDTYSLKGTSAAYKAINKECGF